MNKEKRNKRAATKRKEANKVRVRNKHDEIYHHTMRKAIRQGMYQKHNRKAHD
jgi:hypothetical protein